MPNVSRRQLLVRGGVVVGTLTLARVPSAAWAASASRLSSARRTTYRQLVGALGRSPDGRARHKAGALAARDFAEWYGAQPATLRAHADAVLDDLGRWWDGSYAGLTRSAGAARTATVASALGLAERTTEPPPLDEDDRSVTSALQA
jgi:hypothetical protein